MPSHYNFSSDKLEEYDPCRCGKDRRGFVGYFLQATQGDDKVEKYGALEGREEHFAHKRCSGMSRVASAETYISAVEEFLCCP